MKKEKEWKVINFAPNYKISNYGEVFKFRGDKSPRMMKLKTDKDGYLSVQLSYKGKKYYKRIHRLVAMYFVENENPEKYNVVNHKNGIRDDNYFENLEWCDVTYNNKYSWENFDREAPHSTDIECNLYIDNIFIKKFNSISQACKYAKENYNIPYYGLQKNYFSKNAKLEILKKCND